MRGSWEKRKKIGRRSGEHTLYCTYQVPTTPKARWWRKSGEFNTPLMEHVGKAIEDRGEESAENEEKRKCVGGRERSYCGHWVKEVQEQRGGWEEVCHSLYISADYSLHSKPRAAGNQSGGFSNTAHRGQAGGNILHSPTHWSIHPMPNGLGNSGR